MKKAHEILFSPYQLGGVELKNRYVMVAMGTGGMVTPENTFNQRGVDYYVERARGGVGLIITGTLYVENDIEQVVDGVMPCPTDHTGAFIMSSSEMCERVHAYGTKIFAQLTAGFGRVIKPHLLKSPPISASEIPHFWDPSLTCRALTREEIQTIVKKAGETAKICKQAGFDGVEIHAVHEGYLLDQFAMKLFNKRDDEYGGDLRGRLKFACDIVRSIKEQCGEDFPVLLRYSLKSYIKDQWKGGLPGEDFEEQGRDIEEGIEAAEILRDAGYDGFDVDAGTYDSWYWAHPPMYFEPGMNRIFGKQLKNHMDVPVLVAGRMDDPDMAAASIENGETDLIGLGRPLLADPCIVNKIRREELGLIRPCLGCHEGCMNRLVSAKPVSCAVNPSCGRETIYSITPTAAPKHVAIVGGGPAGMEAARVLALRGHKPHLFERSDQLGGALRLAGGPDFKHDDIRLADWYTETLRRMNVPVSLCTDGAQGVSSRDDWDCVILATGSQPRRLVLPGTPAPIHLAEEVLVGNVQLGEEPVLIGGGLVGCELALHLLRRGKNVTIVEAAQDILSTGAAMPYMNRTMLRDLLDWHKAKIVTGAHVLSADGTKLLCRIGTEDVTVEGSDLICAVGYHANDDLYHSYQNLPVEVYRVGDCKSVHNIMNAIWDAYELGRSL